MSNTRGIVLESNDGWSTILMEGGHYKKVRRTLEVGDIYQENGSRLYTKYTAAAVFLLVLLGTIDFFNVVAYASVSNGIKMGVNRWDRVITVQQTDEVPGIALDELHLKGQKLEEAVAILVQNTMVDTQKPQDIEININSQKNGNEKLEEKLLVKIEVSVTEENKANLKKNTTLVRNGKNIQIKTKENQSHKNNPPGQSNDKGNSQLNPAGSKKANLPADSSNSAQQTGIQQSEQQKLNQNNLNSTGAGPQINQDKAVGAMNEDNLGKNKD